MQPFVSGQSMTDKRERLLKAATYASVATASLLVIAKLYAWLATGSISLMASLVDSLMDVGASAVNLVAVRYALMPPDDEYRFGHGKAEALAGLAQAMFILGSAIFLVLHAFDRLFNPTNLSNLEEGMAVIAFSMVATIALLSFQYFVIRHTESTAIRADALHYTADLATNGAAVIALVLATQGLAGLDPLIGIGIAAYIAYSAVRIGSQAVNLLMDRELPASFRATIERTALATPGVLGLHGLRTWQSGLHKIIQMHIELDPAISLERAHLIADDVERRIHKVESSVDVTIHQDPLGLAEGQSPGDQF